MTSCLLALGVALGGGCGDPDSALTDGPTDSILDGGTEADGADMSATSDLGPVPPQWDAGAGLDAPEAYPAGPGSGFQLDAMGIPAARTGCFSPGRG